MNSSLLESVKYDLKQKTNKKTKQNKIIKQ